MRNNDDGCFLCASFITRVLLRGPMRNFAILMTAAIFPALLAGPAAGADYIQVAGIIDTRTAFSDGELSVEALTGLAKARGFEAVFFTDHDRLVMEYGIFPLEHLLRKRETLNSIHEQGAGGYLEAIRQARRKFPEMILVPGAESVPYYYWTGSYLDGNLTAHDHEKRLLAVGLEITEDYEHMPILHNGFSTRYAAQFIPQLLIFAGVLIIGLVLIREKRRLARTVGAIACVGSALLMVNTMPFRSSPYDQYMGDQGIAPYQLYIDFVNSAGGMTFWNYPETRSGIRPLGPIRLNTPPYPEVLEQASGYTGFAAIYGDTITVTEPGRQWDSVLRQYCRGERNQPVWGIATADYHSETGAGGALGNFPTVFLVREKSREDLLEAMRAGRMYALRSRYPQRMILNEFSVSDSITEETATLGEEIDISGKPRIRMAVSSTAPVDGPVKIRLIRAGEVIRTLDATLPFEVETVDEEAEAGVKTYYRLDVRGPAGVLVGNPVFVTPDQAGVRRRVSLQSTAEGASVMHLASMRRNPNILS